MVGREDITINELNLIPGSHLHFIGIGGSSMSGIAEIALHRGYKVSGSDRACSDAITRLESLGAIIYKEHCSENITNDCTLVIYTLAISDDNPEYLKAHELGIPTIERGTFLGAIAREYSSVTAVAGTHGKTSTTSMLASILIEGNKDPSVHLGGISSTFNSNVRTGHSDIFVTEACEYHENFLHISPQIGIILNVEAEHLDYFGSVENIIKSFSKFIEGIEDDGLLVVCADSPLALECAATALCNVATYSIHSPKAPDNFFNKNGKAPVKHYYAANIAKDITDSNSEIFSITSGYSFSLYTNSLPVNRFTLNVPGKHNVSNALAAIAVAEFLNCPQDHIATGLLKFKGAGRRFDVAGRYNGAYIINDYAHHPTEIKVTIDAAKANCLGEVWSVFQPHTYSRALRFKEEFCEALKRSDHVIITDIYAAREPYTDKISSAMLNELFCEAGIDSLYISDFDSIAKHLKSNLSNGDVALLLGAGTINKLAPMIAEEN